MPRVRAAPAKNTNNVTGVRNNRARPPPAIVSFQPPAFPALPPIDGVRLAAVESAANYRGRDDLMLAAFDREVAVAGVLTQSGVPGAPVDWCRQHLPHGRARALLVNAGCANACTGETGARHVRQTCEAVGAALGCAPERVFAASTGVIGEPLAIDKIIDALPPLIQSLDVAAWRRAAQAITTTDTFAKGATARATIDGATVTINGIAKGSGMIAPNMATMLGFIFTDAAIAPRALQSMLTRGVADTFNAISVDGDTSTSDMCLAFAVGAAGNAPLTDDDAACIEFQRALDEVLAQLAWQIVRDGEGANKVIVVDVRGAENHRAAQTVARAIANSPLVKTAVAGADANWGRVAMAVGKSGARVDASRLDIFIGGIAVAERGQRAAHDEAALRAQLQKDEVAIAVDLHIADGAARVLTCDLTRRYVDINADYRS